MRNRAYRRSMTDLHFVRRKKIINSVKNWDMTDEQIKVGNDHAVNWMSNEWWACSYKKKCNRQRRHNLKNKIKKEIWD